MSYQFDLGQPFRIRQIKAEVANHHLVVVACYHTEAYLLVWSD